MPLVLAMSLITTRLLVEPVHRLSEPAQAVSAGDWSQQVAMKSLISAHGTPTHDEIALSACASNSMVTDVIMPGMASRDLTEKEARDIGVFRIVVDVITAAVNEANPVFSLTLQQLRDIYTGKATRWRDVGEPDEPIGVVVREKASGTRGVFDAIVLGERIEPAAPGLKTAMTAGDAAALVQADPFAIG